MALSNSIQILRGNSQSIVNAASNNISLWEGQPLYNFDKNYLTIGGVGGSSVNSAPIVCRELIGYVGDINVADNSYSLSNDTTNIAYRIYGLSNSAHIEAYGENPQILLNANGVGTDKTTLWLNPFGIVAKTPHNLTVDVGGTAKVNIKSTIDINTNSVLRINTNGSDVYGEIYVDGGATTVSTHGTLTVSTTGTQHTSTNKISLSATNGYDITGGNVNITSLSVNINASDSVGTQLSEVGANITYPKINVTASANINMVVGESSINMDSANINVNTPIMYLAGSMGYIASPDSHSPGAMTIHSSNMLSLYTAVGSSIGMDKSIHMSATSSLNLYTDNSSLNINNEDGLVFNSDQGGVTIDTHTSGRGSISIYGTTTDVRAVSGVTLSGLGSVNVYTGQLKVAVSSASNYYVLPNAPDTDESDKVLVTHGPNTICTWETPSARFYRHDLRFRVPTTVGKVGTKDGYVILSVVSNSRYPIEHINGLFSALGIFQGKTGHYYPASGWVRTVNDNDLPVCGISLSYPSGSASGQTIFIYYVNSGNENGFYVWSGYTNPSTNAFSEFSDQVTTFNSFVL